MLNNCTMKQSDYFLDKSCESAVFLTYNNLFFECCTVIWIISKGHGITKIECFLSADWVRSNY